MTPPYLQGRKVLTYKKLKLQQIFFLFIIPKIDIEQRIFSDNTK